MKNIHQSKLVNLYGGSILQKQVKDSVINISKVDIPIEPDTQIQIQIQIQMRFIKKGNLHRT